MHHRGLTFNSRLNQLKEPNTEKLWKNWTEVQDKSSITFSIIYLKLDLCHYVYWIL